MEGANLETIKLDKRNNSPAIIKTILIEKPRKYINKASHKIISKVVNITVICLITIFIGFKDL